jgi:Domain of unknown function (DUF309)
VPLGAAETKPLAAIGRSAYAAVRARPSVGSGAVYRTSSGGASIAGQASRLEEGLELIRRGEYFAAHEVLEDEWRAAETAERDFYQGLVHVAVAWYQAGRGNRVGCERQLAKAARRLRPYAPAHRGVELESLLEQLESESYPPRESPRI